MFAEYIRAALEQAKYEFINDERCYYGSIASCRGVWASGKTLEECRKNLQEVLEGWILIRLKKGLDLPPIKGHKLIPPKKIPVHA